jgi:hypothetical protein
MTFRACTGSIEGERVAMNFHLSPMMPLCREQGGQWGKEGEVHGRAG